LEISGLPSHILILKIGAPLVLLRNINPQQFFDGTRLCVKTLKRNIIEVTILPGCGIGENVFIPRIRIKPSDMPYQIERLQNLIEAGLLLDTPCFDQGKLYLACSRGDDSK